MKIIWEFGNKAENYGVAGQSLLRALNGSPHPLLNRILDSDARFAGKSARNYAEACFRRYLRELVNAWIDSGRKKDVEEPWTRRVNEPEYNALLAAVVIPGGILKSQWDGFIGRNPPRLELTAEGSRLYLSSRLEGEGSWHDAAFAAFLQVMDSPEGVKIARCNGCRTYFLRERMPKKNTPIKRGSWCASCKRDGRDRVQRTNESRDQRATRMVGWAANALAQWKPDRRHGDRTEWIAEKVNERLKSDKPQIKKNWVTWHKDEIEAEVARRAEEAEERRLIAVMKRAHAL